MYRSIHGDLTCWSRVGNLGYGRPFSTKPSARKTRSNAKVRKNFSDYIIVGTGSSACPLAKKLIDAGNTVTMFEAGGSNNLIDVRDVSKVKDMYSFYSTNSCWNFKSQPQTQLDNRQVSIIGGKLQGGSSSMNGMIYVRGSIRDYQLWYETSGFYDYWSDDNIATTFDNFPINKSLQFTEGIQVYSELIEAALDCGIEFNENYNNMDDMMGAAYSQLNAINFKRQDSFTTFLTLPLSFFLSSPDVLALPLRLKQ